MAAPFQTLCPNSRKEGGEKGDPVKEGYSSGNQTLCRMEGFPVRFLLAFHWSELCHKAVPHCKGSLGYELSFFLAFVVEVGREKGLGKPYSFPT